MPSVTFPAPRKGWVKNQTLINADRDAAEVLDNVFPTAQGARLRKGTSKHATVPANAVRLLVYRSGTTEEMFAATAAGIYDVSSPADADVAPSAAVGSLTSGDWAAQMFSTSGGNFLTLANGADTVRQYDGTTWSAPSITGVTTSNLSFVWAFKNRLWFVQKNTQSAWYLATNAVTGAATEFPLRGVFNRGGNLLFGATWSIDAGDGIDDVIVFATDQGEVAVYQGTDPASDFQLSGVYYIGKPLNKHAWFRAGGDLAVATEDGIISIAEALRKDRGALAASALTFPIEDAWAEVVANATTSYPVNVTLWASQTMLVVGTPQISNNLPVAFVANSRTGAWARFVNYDVRCAVVFGDAFYFGTGDATVVQAETGGDDLGAEYQAAWVPKFQEGNAAYKAGSMARFRGRAGEEYNIGLACFSDYEVRDLAAVPSTAVDAANAWGTGVWGTMVWGGNEYRAYVSEWQSVHGFGSSLAPALSIASQRATEPTLEFIGLDLVYEQGKLV